MFVYLLLIGIHAMQVWTATDTGLQQKEEDKDQKIFWSEEGQK